MMVMPTVSSLPPSPPRSPHPSPLTGGGSGSGRRKRHRRRTTSERDHDDNNDHRPIDLEHDDCHASSMPDSPAHPALEFETTTREQQRQSCHSKASISSSSTTTDWKFFASFLLLVLTGSANVVFSKLQAIPMYNYPSFLNIFVNLVYVPVCFAYVVPAYYWYRDDDDAAIIPHPVWTMSKRPFAVMGALDCLACSMQVFATIYLPGPLLVLLPQAAIPVSMVLSRHVLHEHYHHGQYAGAIIVLVGIAVVLQPLWSRQNTPNYYCQARNMHHDCTVCQVEGSEQTCLAHAAAGGTDDKNATLFWRLTDASNTTNDDYRNLCQWLPSDQADRREEVLQIVWSAVMLASCLPLCLSTIYKQKVMGNHGNSSNGNNATVSVDPIFLNGWVAIFQVLFSIVIAVPAAYWSFPSIAPWDVPRNLYQGLLCYLGHGSEQFGCHPDAGCDAHAMTLVNAFVVANLAFCATMMYVIKYGSTALMFLATTIQVPVSNLVFCLPFMPQSATMHLADIVGLLVILAGLVLYRMADPAMRASTGPSLCGGHHNDDSLDLPGEIACFAEEGAHRRPLLEPLLSSSSSPGYDNDALAAPVEGAAMAAPPPPAWRSIFAPLLQSLQAHRPREGSAAEVTEEGEDDRAAPARHRRRSSSIFDAHRTQSGDV